MKLILNDTEYDHFEITVPLVSFAHHHMTSGLRYRGTVHFPRPGQFAYVTIFTNSEKATVLNEWCFEKSNLEMGNDVTIIKDAILVQAAPRV